MKDPGEVFVLNENDHEAWHLLERLVGRGPATLRNWVRRPWYRAQPSRELVQAVARLFSAAVLETLFNASARPRVVLRSRNGRVEPVASRLWDPDVNAALESRPLEPRFTEASDQLWRTAIEVLGQELGATHSDAERVRDRARKVTRGFAPEPAHALGDHLAFVLFHQNLHRLHLAEAIERRAAGKLRSGSILARLFAPAESGSALSLALLENGHLLRAVELLMSSLNSAWADAAALLWQTTDREQLILRSRTMASSIHQWLVLTESHGRIDLAEPVVEWFVAVAQAPSDWRARLAGVSGVSTLAERDELAGILAQNIDLDALDQRLAALAAARYGDERYVEARLVLATLEERLAPHREQVRARIGQLRGRLG